MPLRHPPGYVIVALSAVVPLLVPELWTGYRLALSDTVLAVISGASGR